MKPITVGNNVVAEFDIAGGDTLGDEFYISEGVQVLLAVTSGSASVALEVSVDRAVWVPGGLTMTAAGIYNSLVRGVWGRFRATGAAFVASVTVRSLATREAETQATSTAATRAHNDDAAAHGKSDLLGVLGDSMVAYAETNPGGVSTTIRWGINHWPHQAAMWAGNGLLVDRPSGIGGNTTQMVLDRLDAFLETKYGYVCVLVGTNDITSGIQLATITANLASIYQRINATGARVIACHVLPRLSTDTAAKRELVCAVNDWISAYCSARDSGMILCDWYPAMADTAGNLRDAYHAAGDVHPNGTGFWAMGKFLGAVMAKHIPGKDRLARGWLSQQYNTNPLSTGNASGFPTGWTASGGATATKVARTDGIPGEWVELTCSATVSGGAIISTPAVLPAVGDTIYGIAEIEVISGTLLRNVNFEVRCEYSGVNLLNSDAWFRSGSDLDWPEVPAGIMTLVSPPIVVPATTNRFRIAINVNLQTGGAAIVRVGRVFVVRAKGLVY